MHGISTLATGMKTSIKVYFRKKVTEQYPENRATLKMFDRFCGELTMPHDAGGKNKCIACGLCAKVCPAEAIKVSENRAFIYSDLCLSCGACAMACPRHVIHDKRGILTPRV